MVDRDLAKVEIAGSSPVYRFFLCPGKLDFTGFPGFSMSKIWLIFSTFVIIPGHIDNIRGEVPAECMASTDQVVRDRNSGGP